VNEVGSVVAPLRNVYVLGGGGLKNKKEGKKFWLELRTPVSQILPPM